LREKTPTVIARSRGKPDAAPHMIDYRPCPAAGRAAGGSAVVQRINERLVNWASIIEPGTLAQAKATASLPFVFPHVALMPDAPASTTPL
jgi:hypothetical protein